MCKLQNSYIINGHNIIITAQRSNEDPDRIGWIVYDNGVLIDSHKWYLSNIPSQKEVEEYLLKAKKIAEEIKVADHRSSGSKKSTGKEE